MPNPDAQSSRFPPRRPHTSLPSHSMPVFPPAVQLPITPPPEHVGIFEDASHDRAVDFASQSWDLATGGLKTLTAKRELPPLHHRRTDDIVPGAENVPRSYAFLLVIMVCLVLMLASGGVILFMMLQP